MRADASFSTSRSNCYSRRATKHMHRPLERDVCAWGRTGAERAIEQHDGPVRPECVAAQSEAFVLLKKDRLSAAGYKAFPLPLLGTGAEPTQPAQVAVRARLHHEDLYLVMGDADAGVRQQLVEGPPACLAERLIAASAGMALCARSAMTATCRTGYVATVGAPRTIDLVQRSLCVACQSRNG
jgi:hypothetical protein